MEFYLYRRPYNVGMGWKLWRKVEAANKLAALKSTEFKEERMHQDHVDESVGILGGVSEFLCLTWGEVVRYTNESGNIHYAP